jgi:hypothetical protein
MQEKVCDIWLEPAEFRCIPTSGTLSRSGEAVLDTALAREAAQRFHGLASDLGRLIAARGNHVHLIRAGLLSFPIRQYDWARPSPEIIERSARELGALVGTAKTLLPRPGCGPGELTWEVVAPVLSFLPDNIIVVRHA